MSLIDDQLASFEPARTNAKTHHRAAEKFLVLLWERAVHESHYAEGLMRLANHPYTGDVQGGLGQAIREMKEKWQIHGRLCQKLSCALTADLIDPLRELLKQQHIAYKSQMKIVSRAQKELKAGKEHVGAMKYIYKKQLEDTERAVLAIEHTQNLAEKKKLVNSQHEDINKNMERATKMYRDAIKDYNAYLANYHKEVSTVLDSFKMQEEERLQNVENGIKKLRVLEAALASEFSVFISESHASLSAIDCDLDIFQTNNRKDAPDPGLEEFSPYRGVHLAFQDMCEASPIFAWTGENASFTWQVSLDEKFAAEMDRAKGKVEVLMHKAWQEPLNSEEIAAFRSVVEEPIGRKAWVSYMNAKRASGSFRLLRPGMTSVAELMNIVLDVCQGKKDISTASLCTILSQTFFTFRGTEKLFLQTFIQHHALWERAEVWVSMLQEAIETKLEKQRVYGGDLTDVRNVVFAQLSAFKHLMMSFEVDSETVRKLMERKCWEYKLSSEEMSTLIEVDSPQSDSSSLQRSRSLELFSSLLEEEIFEVRDRRCSFRTNRNCYRTSVACTGRKTATSDTKDRKALEILGKT